VDVLHDEVVVAHGAGGGRGVLEADHGSDTVDVERVALEVGRGMCMAAVMRLVRIGFKLWYNAIVAYLFCRLSLK
jgi:hypothetical protein